MNIEKYNSFFEKCANSYLENAKNETHFIHLNRKKEHSYRVAKFAVRIAKSLGFSEYDIFIVNIMALFHDIGRFEQFRKYGTYDDLITENHALLSLNAIDESKVLSEIKVQDINLIRKCIFWHNEAKIPENITERERLYAGILRDADKLDFIKAMIDIIPNLPKDEQKVFYTNKPGEEVISENVYNKIMGKQIVLNCELKTKLDKQVRAIGYITSDMKNKESFKIALENNYLEKIYEMLPKQEQVTNIYNMTKEYIIQKIK